MSPGFIMSGGCRLNILMRAKLYNLGRAKVFSSVATDFGPGTSIIFSRFNENDILAHFIFGVHDKS